MFECSFCAIGTLTGYLDWSGDSPHPLARINQHIFTFVLQERPTISSFLLFEFFLGRCDIVRD